MDSFLGFVVIVIVWLVAGSIGASWLTKKGYLAPENATASARPHYTLWTTSSGAPAQYFVAFFGPAALVAGMLLPVKATK
ncbi:MAG TPA: hypothetical protein VFF59_03075 [Anaerolineae bacterium]|nr:hypothetical protein [Anaerolineae bacterium]